jgi:hypothetical protein
MTRVVILLTLTWHLTESIDCLGWYFISNSWSTCYILQIGTTKTLPRFFYFHNWEARRRKKIFVYLVEFLKRKNESTDILPSWVIKEISLVNVLWCWSWPRLTRVDFNFWKEYQLLLLALYCLQSSRFPRLDAIHTGSNMLYFKPSILTTSEEEGLILLPNSASPTH